MARMVFSEVVGTMSFLQPQCDDDSVDRLHYYYTPSFLLVFAVLISLKMFGGSPIECWLPAEFKPSWQEYTELICWSMSTYFVRGALHPQGLAEPKAGRAQAVVAYYQWTPFFLVFSAMLFYSPCLVWRKLAAKSGLVLSEVVGFAKAIDRCPTTAGNLAGAAREAKLRGIAAHLSSVLRYRHRQGPADSWHLRFFHGAYLASLYLAIKLLFLAIVLLQACLMNRFLQTDRYDFYGWGVLWDLLQGRVTMAMCEAWQDSGNFPRITFCDIDVRILGSVQKYTVQCILVINIFTEKVFVLLWAWYSLLLLVTLLNGLGWLQSCSLSSRKRFIGRRLQLADVQFEALKLDSQLDQFVRDFLKADGCFVLRMLDVHTGEWVCAEIVDLVWEEFQQTQQRKVAEMSPQSHSQMDDDNIPEKPKTITRKQSKKMGLLRPLALAARPLCAENEASTLPAWASLPDLWTSANRPTERRSHEEEKFHRRPRPESSSSRMASRLAQIGRAGSEQTSGRHWPTLMGRRPAVSSRYRPVISSSRSTALSPLARGGFSARQIPEMADEEEEEWHHQESAADEEKDN